MHLNDHVHDHDQNPDDDRLIAGTDGTLRIAGVTSIVFAGAIFGFFYAWVCSTMWGLDDADPRVAIEAMQAMNASVRNAVFFPAFFLTPVVLGGTALLARERGNRRAARAFGAGALVYLLGGLVLTMALNVPMNEELADVVVPASIDEARVVWDDYSGIWQVYNITRTVFSGIALALAGIGLIEIGRRPAAGSGPTGTAAGSGAQPRVSTSVS